MTKKIHESKIALNACPFCGKISEAVNSNYGVYIRCKNCKCRTPCLSIDEAAALWNQSTPRILEEVKLTDFEKTLKPCKKCGGERGVIYRFITHDMVRITCLSCNSSIVGTPGTRTDPVIRWNKEEQMYFDCVVPGCTIKAKVNRTQCGIHTKEEIDALIDFSNSSDSNNNPSKTDTIN
jgi:hypothetical protein